MNQWINGDVINYVRTIRALLLSPGACLLISQMRRQIAIPASGYPQSPQINPEQELAMQWLTLPMSKQYITRGILTHILNTIKRNITYSAHSAL